MTLVGTRAPETRLALHRPGSSRMHDYFLGGKDNYAVDRALADQVLTVLPQLGASVRAGREFLARAVRVLAGRGVRQFLDLGCGLPTAGALHQIVARHAPGARIVYVDNDPLVIAHARALPIDGGNVAVLRADIRDADSVLGSAEVRHLIDPTEPVALVFASVLHFLPDAADLVAALGGAATPGSGLIVSHATADFAPDACAEAARLYLAAEDVPVIPRAAAEVARLLGPFRPLSPGLVPLTGGPLGGPFRPGHEPITYGVVGVR